jgi:hypothetical protein
MSKTNLPGFTAEASLYASIKGYVVASNIATSGGDAVVPALMKQVCWDQTSGTSKFLNLTFVTECQICQWFIYTRICPQPPACSWGWVAVGEPSQDCISRLSEIE